jgi:hypothetical protein
LLAKTRAPCREFQGSTLITVIAATQRNPAAGLGSSPQWDQGPTPSRDFLGTIFFSRSLTHAKANPIGLERWISRASDVEVPALTTHRSSRIQKNNNKKKKHDYEQTQQPGN